MWGLGNGLVYQLYRKACDMRKGCDGLSGLVSHELGRDPLSGEVFIFLNRTGNLIKLLRWEAGGFVLYYKRLEEGTFTPPLLEEGSTLIKWPELVLMLEGITIKEYKQNPRFKLEKQVGS
jgi:transposase